MKEELARRASSKDRILAILQAEGSITNAFMNNHICNSYLQRLDELRDAGYLIRTERVKGGLFIYHYEGRKPADTRKPADLNTVPAAEGRLF